MLGPREIEAGVLAVTDPASGGKASVPLSELGDRLAEAARKRVLRVGLVTGVSTGSTSGRA